MVGTSSKKANGKAKATTKSTRPSDSSSADKIPRGKNYDRLEDEMISRMWVRISGDSIVSTNQTSERFWTRICKAFYEEPKIVEEVESGNFERRKWGSLKSRFKHITASVGKLMKCLREIESRQGSGMMDDYCQALQLFECTSKGKKRFEL